MDFLLILALVFSLISSVSYFVIIESLLLVLNKLNWEGTFLMQKTAIWMTIARKMDVVEQKGRMTKTLTITIPVNTS